MSFSISSNLVQQPQNSSQQTERVVECNKTSQATESLEKALQKVGQALNQPQNETPTIFSVKRNVFSSSDDLDFSTPFNVQPPQTPSKSKAIRKLSPDNSTLSSKKRILSPSSENPLINFEENVPAPFDFSSFLFNQESYAIPQTPALRRKKIPPTPRKNISLKEVSPFETLFRKVNTTKEIEIDKQIVMLTFLKEGSYMMCYKMNDQIVKFYHGKKMGFNEQMLNSCLENSKQNYLYAKNSGLSVATIHNFETVLSDRFFVQEFIPFRVDVNNQEHMQQVKRFFITVLENKATVSDKKEKRKFDLDLHPKNLRVKSDGTVTLVDFIENNKDGFFIQQAIKMWAERYKKNFEKSYQGDLDKRFEVSKEATKNFLESFTKDFKQYKDYSVDENGILDDLFFQVISIIK